VQAVMKTRIVLWLSLLALAGCAFGSMPNTASKDFWYERDARMQRW